MQQQIRHDEETLNSMFNTIMIYYEAKYEYDDKTVCGGTLDMVMRHRQAVYLTQ